MSCVAVVWIGGVLCLCDGQSDHRDTTRGRSGGSLIQGKELGYVRPGAQSEDGGSRDDGHASCCGCRENLRREKSSSPSGEGGRNVSDGRENRRPSSLPPKDLNICSGHSLLLTSGCRDGYYGSRGDFRFSFCGGGGCGGYGVRLR